MNSQFANAKKKSDDFWAMIRKVADGARGKPDWMHAGINLNERNFVTFPAATKGD